MHTREVAPTAPAREPVAVELRARREEDLDACERLAQAVHHSDGYPPRFADDLRWFVAAPGAIRAWVAESAGDVIGHVALQPTSSEAVMALASEVTGWEPHRLCVVARLFVSPTARRTGVGRSLLTVAAETGRSRGLWPILDVAVQFDGAIRLYEASGWVCAGRVTARFSRAEPLEEYVFIGPRPEDVAMRTSR